MTKPIRLIRSFATVGSWTMMSRVLGLVREIMFAAFLGSGPVIQAFLIAFSLPNMFRRLFAEAAFNMAFVPIFAKKVEKGDDPLGFARDALTALASILLVLTIVAQIFTPALVWLMAAGFAGDERFDLAVLYGRIAFPYVLFITLAALLSGVLNALGHFAAAAAAPVLLNIVFITAVVAAYYLGFDMGLTLSWAVPVAGVAQLALVWIAARRAGYTLIPRRPRMTPELKRLFLIAAPAALAGGVVQINLLVGRNVSSAFDGAIAWLYYADRLYQLPLGVVGIAIGVVLLPDLSRKLAAGDTPGGQDAFSRAGEIAMALTIPCAIALIIIPAPIISIIFERGAFTSDDTARTALAVAVYGAGLPAFVLQKVLQPVYFARHDTKRPFYFAVVAMIVNAVIAIGLAPVIGYIAAAFATTIAGWAMAWQLWRNARQFGAAAQFDARFKRRLPRIIMASIAMGVVLWALFALLLTPLSLPIWRYFTLAVLLGLGALSYMWIGQLIGAFDKGEFRKAVRR